ncbi:MAG TPA: 3-hydroxyacyl-CoA dehydrogenase family protein [Gemmatimonadales bacterium]|nr:3-hydroxyacyl-CoA dehydrogenase family protein [Gemmatimonadales bacterium]
MAEIHRIAVIGAGTMGAGIGQVAAAAGYDVVVADTRSRALAEARERAADGLARGVAKGKLTREEADAALGRFGVAGDVAEAASTADLVVEAIPESLELKRELFAVLDLAAPPHAVLASNTSSLSITAIAEATRRPAQVLGMHFFNPVPAMRLVELVRGQETSDATLAAARAVVERLGKTPIVVKDMPGFATSRLGIVLGLEAIRMLEQGVASAEDIDRAMELGYNHPMGPLRLGDLVGLDVRLAIADHLHATLKDDTYRAPELLRRMVAEGRLGRKTGEGFYRWEETR